MTYEGCYLKLAGDPTYWLVLDGERIALSGPGDLIKHGLRRVVTVGLAALEEIPVQGEEIIPAAWEYDDEADEGE